MLPCTERAFRGYLAGQEVREIVASDRWYEERADFLPRALGTPHPVHRESRGFGCCRGWSASAAGCGAAALPGNLRDPDMLCREIEALRGLGAFDGAAGVLVGKPQDERWYEEYKPVWRAAVGNADLPILYNVNFGHALPCCALPYVIEAEADARSGRITLLESMFDTSL